MKLRRIGLFAVLGALVFGLGGCGGSDDASTTNSNASRMRSWEHSPGQPRTHRRHNSIAPAFLLACKSIRRRIQPSSRSTRQRFPDLSQVISTWLSRSRRHRTVPRFDTDRFPSHPECNQHAPPDTDGTWNGLCRVEESEARRPERLIAEKREIAVDGSGGTSAVSWPLAVRRASARSCQNAHTRVKPARPLWHQGGYWKFSNIIEDCADSEMRKAHVTD